MTIIEVLLGLNLVVSLASMSGRIRGARHRAAAGGGVRLGLLAQGAERRADKRARQQAAAIVAQLTAKPETSPAQASPAQASPAEASPAQATEHRGVVVPLRRPLAAAASRSMHQHPAYAEDRPPR